MKRMIRINVTVRPETWEAFRIACIQRKTLASREIERLMHAQLQRWQQDKAIDAPPSDTTT